MTAESNRVTTPIASQEEADGIAEGLERRKATPPGELTPEMEEQIANDEARLAQWQAMTPENKEALATDAPDAKENADA